MKNTSCRESATRKSLRLKYDNPEGGGGAFWGGGPGQKEVYTATMPEKKGVGNKSNGDSDLTIQPRRRVRLSGKGNFDNEEGVPDL